VRTEVRRSILILLIRESGAVIDTTIRWGFPCAALALSAYFLAGKQTGVHLEGLLRAFANQWIFMIIAGLCGGGWAIERRALRRRIKQMAAEKTELESIIDTDRSSSGITEHGSPNRPKLR
jgi:hypothetical protein